MIALTLTIKKESGEEGGRRKTKLNALKKIWNLLKNCSSKHRTKQNEPHSSPSILDRHYFHFIYVRTVVKRNTLVGEKAQQLRALDGCAADLGSSPSMDMEAHHHL